MKYRVFRNKIDLFVYILIIAIGVMIIVVYTNLSNLNYENLKNIALKDAQKELENSVNNLIIIIDNIKDEKTKSLNQNIYSEQIDQNNLTEEIKNQIHDLILSLSYYDNKYFWINEVINFEGGDNYAIRRVHQFLKDTEGTYLSTNTYDIANNLPYKIELEGIVANGEVFQSYYFENPTDGRITEKLTYAKLYEPFNWIVASGIPYEDIYSQANKLYARNKSILALIYVIDFILVVSSILAYYLFSRKKSIEERERVANEKNEIKTEFIENMSHDLRTPLNAIVGLTQIARNNDLEKSEVQEYLYKIGISSNYLLTLIDDILDISALEEGKLSIKTQPCFLKDLIYPISSFFYLRGSEKGIKFNCSILFISQELILCDVYRVKQILSNLLSNSVKFTEDGGSVELFISQKQIDIKHVVMEFEVKDTGCGIEKDQLDNIYSKFVQADKNIKSEYGGSGLGLSIVKNLVDLMNGKINVKSKKGVGTSFIVDLPFEFVDKKTSTNDILAGKGIFVIDDKKSCEHLQLICKELNINCHYALDYTEGYNKIKENISNNVTYDYIIVSLSLNDIDVMKMLPQINELINHDTSTLLVCDYAQELFDEQFRSYYLTKPIFKSTFVSVLENIESGCLINKMDLTKEKDTVEGFSVLLVEDNKINQLVARKILEIRKASVDIANNGEEAYNLFIEKGDNYYDLILMDYKMPVLDGIESTKLIRESNLSYAKKVKIYAMTANTSSRIKQECLAAKMDGHISKPIDVSLLTKLIIDLNNKKSKI
ncbi:MAG: ATP-binding protein [Sphaerochaetaceae bacterium]|nr:ATP-binding protein [Sphaerochaetaceae bacterium]